MTTLQSLESYGTKFQLKVISSLLNNKKFLTSVFDILNTDDFTSQSHKWIVQQIINYYNKYHTNPTLEILKTEMKKVENEVLKIAIKEELRNAYISDVDDADYYEQEFSKFCKNQQLKKALLESADLLTTGEFDSIRGLISNALKAGERQDIGHEYEKDIETRYRENNRKTIPFPWEAFNKVTEGGYGKGDLVLIFGNPKGGKSWVTIAMAAYAAYLGFNITFYALELGEDYVGKRFDAFFSGIEVSELKNHRKEVEEAVAKIKGKIVIKEYPPKRASLATIESHQNHLKEQYNFVSDAIFVDYLDLLKNRTTGRRERKDDIDDVYTEAKGYAKELDIPIISPSQANRSGAGKKILESEHIAGSFDKIMIGDIVISLARNRVDKLKGTGIFHFMGNRYGDDGISFKAEINTKNGHIVVNEEQVDIDEEERDNEDVEILEKKLLKKKFFEMNNL